MALDGLFVRGRRAQRWCLSNSSGCAHRPSICTLIPGAILEYSYSFDQELQNTIFCLFLQARLYWQLRLFPKYWSVVTTDIKMNGMPLPWSDLPEPEFRYR